MKILLGIPSPRNIPQVLRCWYEMDADFIMPRHYREWSAYQIIRDFFLQEKQYTHLVLAADDLVFTQKNLNILKNDIRIHDYPIISGVCTVDGDWNRPINIIPDYLPSLNPKERSFPFIEYSELKENITRVKFAGFPLMAIRRDIVEKIDFDSETKLTGGDPNSIGNIDLIFCHNCEKLNIPIYVDKRIYMLHMRGNGNLINNDPSVRKIFWRRSGVLYVLRGHEWVKETGQIGG